MKASSYYQLAALLAGFGQQFGTESQKQFAQVLLDSARGSIEAEAAKEAAKKARKKKGGISGFLSGGLGGAGTGAGIGALLALPTGGLSLLGGAAIGAGVGGIAGGTAGALLPTNSGVPESLNSTSQLSMALAGPFLSQAVAAKAATAQPSVGQIREAYATPMRRNGGGIAATPSLDSSQSAMLGPPLNANLGNKYRSPYGDLWEL